ncbi:mitochondrial K+-H+ exchange-related-domain-containing protein [Nemania sp. NC0429]|nr:mitochondrial K+-H+ exchange-related-domain-containing protein [Nemania sp. NC0429]
MRLFLLPISTRRTLLYCQKLQVLPPEKQGWIDKITLRATKLWAGWEQKESGWQKSVVKYGNGALRRIPYEEWGLKSVPTLSARRKQEEILGKEKHHLIFPQSVISVTRAPQILHTLATERKGLHRSRMLWCFVGMPITAPFALVPVIPNLPFFYLVFRAWSHYRALAGGKHLQWLSSNNFFTLWPSEILDSIYPRHLPSSNSPEQESHHSSPESPHQGDNSPVAEERLLLTQDSGRKLARALEVPELEAELERAIWQVENDMRKQTKMSEESSPSSKSEQSKPENK